MWIRAGETTGLPGCPKTYFPLSHAAKDCPFYHFLHRKRIVRLWFSPFVVSKMVSYCNFHLHSLFANEVELHLSVYWPFLLLCHADDVAHIWDTWVHISWCFKINGWMIIRSCFVEGNLLHLEILLAFSQNYVGNSEQYPSIIKCMDFITHYIRVLYQIPMMRFTTINASRCLHFRKF